MTEAANTRLRAVTDYVEADPWPDPMPYRLVLAALAIILTAWAFNPGAPGPKALLTGVVPIHLFTEGLAERLRARRPEGSIGEPGRLSLADLTQVGGLALAAVLMLWAEILLLIEGGLWFALFMAGTGALMLLGFARLLVHGPARHG